MRLFIDDALAFMSKPLIIIGLILIIVGLLWPWVQKLKLGHLPGDILIKSGNSTFYFPIVTCILISLIVTLLTWLFYR